MILGGGGSPSPLPELALQTLIIGLFAAWWLDRSRSVPEPAAWRLAGLIAALPLVQLVPLPPALWHALPGREAEQAALALVGAVDSWRPWSIAPARTLAALLALLPALMLLLMTASLDRNGRALVVALVAGGGLVGLVVGVGQLGGGTANPFRFYGIEGRMLTGFEANRNHAADVMIVAMIAFAATLREMALRRTAAASRAPAVLPLLGIVTALFSLGCILTASRAGIALLPLGWGAVLATAWPWVRDTLPAKPAARMATALGCAGLAVIAGLAAIRIPGVAVAAARFSATSDFRIEIWRDSLFAAKSWFPFGAGMGSFPTVFPAAERIEMVDPLVTNRAHMDLLEIAIEGGVFALALALVVAALAVVRGIAALRRPPEGSRGQVIFALTTLAVIALHSLVDYPLRAMSLECLAGVAGGLLLARRRRDLQDAAT